jgi:ankyrin repeat protein
LDPADGRTALTRACNLGHLEIVGLLLDGGAQVNRKDKYKDIWGKDIRQAPLSAACDRRGQDSASVAAITRLLIDHGADVLVAHPDGKDGPLHFAAKHGHLEAVALLLEAGIDVNTKGAYGEMALHHAATHGRSLDLVKILLEKGAQVNAVHQQGSNALFKLISSDEDTVDIARLLIDKGVELESDGLGGALYWAARCGKKKIVELLLENGMNVDSRDYQREETAIAGAMKHKHYDIVKLLLEHGADPDAEDPYDGSLLQQAVELGDQGLVKALLHRINEKKARQKNASPGTARKSMESTSRSKSAGSLVKAAKKGDLAIVKLLIESGIDVNEKLSPENVSPLMNAAAFGKIAVINYLLEKGADITDRDKKGSTALLYAASTGEDEAIKVLLDHGARINEKNDFNWNALMQASFKCQYSTVKLLLDRGSPTDEIDNEKGATALWLAKHAGNAKLIELLAMRGAKERPIRQRKTGEPYFAITDCDICAYLPQGVELTPDYSPEKIEGLEIIYTGGGTDYKAEETELIKKCIHCGTYYHHYHYIDTEDSIGGAGPICSHHVLRYNWLWLHGLLRKLEKLDELAEARARYPSIIESFLRSINAGHEFKRYIRPHVVESLVDYFVTAGEWDSIEKLLLNNTDDAIRLAAVQDLLTIWGEKVREDKFPPFIHCRNFTGDIQQKLKPMLQEHEAVVVAVIKRFKLETCLDAAKAFVMQR